MSEVSAIIEQKQVEQESKGNSLNSTEISTFGTIFNFISELNNVYGEEQHSLLLFNHFIKKVNLSHVTTVRNIIQVFKDFCLTNKQCIQDKNEQLENPVIKLSDKVYIDMKDIFDRSDKDTNPVIWNHILAISLQVDPSGRIKDILRKNLNQHGTKESNFLTKIIDQVEDHIDPNDENPMNAVNSILKSGIFGDLMSSMSQGLSDGSLDIGKLLGAVQDVTSGMSGSDNTGGQIDPLKMLTTMMSGMNNTQ